MKTGELLRKARQSKNLTQRDIGALLGLKSGGQSVANIESGRSPFPTKHLKKIARLLGIDQALIIDSLVREYKEKLEKTR